MHIEVSVTHAQTNGGGGNQPSAHRGMLSTQHYMSVCVMEGALVNYPIYVLLTVHVEGLCDQSLTIESAQRGS